MSVASLGFSCSFVLAALCWSLDQPSKGKVVDHVLASFQVVLQAVELSPQIVVAEVQLSGGIISRHTGQENGARSTLTRE